MASLWAPERRLSAWLAVELAAARAMAGAGLVPAAAVAECEARAPRAFTPADAARIDEIEKTTRHDVIAFLTFLEERIGPAARVLHRGMTSSDVLDTALGMLLRDAADLLIEGCDRAMNAVRARAVEHRRTPIIGRSHGMHAEPTTMGHKLAVWFEELRRGRERLERARWAIAVGKISGAVGTWAHLSPDVEERALADLGLRAEPASTQIVQRDRHAEFFTALALVGASVEKFALEVRHLQRSEVGEAEEPFGAGQKGSSAMPHKKNPILAENLTGLARLLRGYALAALEDVALWHERDISHSSVERVIAPDACATLHFMLHRFAGLVDGWRIHPERMRANLDASRGLIFSEGLLLALCDKGLARQEAYALVQNSALRALEEGAPFKELVLADGEITKRLSRAEIDAAFDLEHHLRHDDVAFERVFGRLP
jgi:adenylosuccinate lyase